MISTSTFKEYEMNIINGYYIIILLIIIKCGNGILYAWKFIHSFKQCHDNVYKFLESFCLFGWFSFLVGMVIV